MVHYTEMSWVKRKVSGLDGKFDFVYPYRNDLMGMWRMWGRKGGTGTIQLRDGPALLHQQDGQLLHSHEKGKLCVQGHRFLSSITMGILTQQTLCSTLYTCDSI